MVLLQSDTQNTTSSNQAVVVLFWHVSLFRVDPRLRLMGIPIRYQMTPPAAGVSVRQYRVLGCSAVPIL